MSGNDGFTKLLVHFSESDSAFMDTSAGGVHGLATNSGVVWDNVNTKFGSTGLFGSGNLSWPTSPDWNLGTDKFTIDWWQLGGSQPFAFYSGVAFDWRGGLYPGGQGMRFQIYKLTGGYFEFTFAYPGDYNPAIWNHWAVVRNGDIANDWFVFVNGISQALTLNSGSWADTLELDYGSPVLNIGGGWVGMGAGNLDEFRLSKGIARWTSNFTPPIIPYGGRSVFPMPCYPR